MCSASSRASGVIALWNASSINSVAVARFTLCSRPNSRGGSPKAFATIRIRNCCQLSRKSASVPCANRNTSGFCSVLISGTRPVPSISSCHHRISRSCCAGVVSFSHSAYCTTELLASFPANRCALRNVFTVSNATSSGPSPNGV